MIENFPTTYFHTPRFIAHDITDFFEEFLRSFLTLIASLFDLLDSITIYGVGLTTLLVSFFIIGVIIPVILTTVKGRATARANAKARAKAHANNKNNKG